MQQKVDSSIKTLYFLLPFPVYAGLHLALSDMLALSVSLVFSFFLAIWSKSFHQNIDRLTWIYTAVILVTASFSITGSLSSDIAVFVLLPYTVLALRPLYKSYEV